MNQDSNNSVSSQNNSTSSIPQWLQQGDISPAVPPKKSKRLLIIIISIILLLSCILVGYAIFVAPSSNNCLSASNYRGLLDSIKTVNSDVIDETAIQPQQLLYTQPVYFQQRTTDFDTEKLEDVVDFLESVGIFYQEQHTTAPFTVQIDTSYLSVDTLKLAQERVARIKDILVQAGQDASSISTPPPTMIQLNDESAEDDDIQDNPPVFVSITPTMRCQ